MTLREIIRTLHVTHSELRVGFGRDGLLTAEIAQFAQCATHIESWEMEPTRTLPGAPNATGRIAENEREIGAFTALLEEEIRRRRA